MSKTLTSRLGPRLGNHRASVVPVRIAIQLGVVALRRGLLVVVWPFLPLLGSCCGHVVVLQGAAFQWWIQVEVLTDSFADIGIAKGTQCR